MIDGDFVNFYNAVKAPAWPAIADYRDYTKLPNYIRHEMNTLHNCQQIVSNMCDRDQRIQHTLNVCVYKNLAFVPLGTCDYIHNTGMFNQLGWNRVRLADVDPGTVFFGCILHPMTRWIKGIVQWITSAYNSKSAQPLETNPWSPAEVDINWNQLHQDLNNKYFNKLVGSVLVSDVHTMPYEVTLGSLLDKINWIPMDQMSDQEVNSCMMNFFKKQGHTINLPLDGQRFDQSNQYQHKAQLLEHIENLILSKPYQLEHFYKIYNKDLLFYYNLIDKFTPNWQHI